MRAARNLVNMTEPAIDPLDDSTNARARRVRDFASSEMFSRAFEEGMNLVEETAAYLDGPGREESRQLSRAGAVAYASESMRLTTRLMQVASWLLVQRSVREGEMTPETAAQEKFRLAEEAKGRAGAEDHEIPARLKDLLARSRKIYERSQRIDQGLYKTLKSANPVGKQVDRLREAFEARRP
nr:DUF1465 family protein [Euryhalocaulis caribicus]